MSDSERHHLQPPPALPGLYWIILIVATNSLIQALIIAALIVFLSKGQL